MIRLRSSRLLASLMGVMLLVVAIAETNACDRCGLFGRRCRFASQSFDHHEGYSSGYGASGGTQTFNFINSYPTPLLAAQGQTVYGYNLSAQAYSVDPALIFDTAARLASNASDLAKQGVSSYTDLALQQLSNQQAIAAEALEVAKVEAQGRAAANALSAAKPASSTSVPKILSYRVTATNGELKVEDISSEPSAAGGATSLSASDHVKSLLAAKCGKCHSGPGSKGVPFLDRTLDHDLVKAILLRSTTDDPSKRMPPSGPKLSVDELSPIFALKSQLAQVTAAPRAASNPSSY